MPISKVVEGCRTQIMKLDKLFEMLLPASTDSRGQKFKKALSSIGKDKEVAAIQKTLENYTQSLILYFSEAPGRTEQDHHLAKVPCAHGAAYNSSLLEHKPRCLAGTRVELLRQLMAWSDNPCGERIFWLNGMAGTGKSTIARTIAGHFADQKRLGASFFFSRGRGDLGRAAKFITSLAAQLADTLPSLKRYICEAIAEHPSISGQALREQWKQLILRPLSQLEGGSLPSSLNLVVDALDECESQDDIRLILQLFAESNDQNGIRLRILVTSRPEVPIRLGFRVIPGVVHKYLVLHDISQSVIEHDISIFLKYELENIKSERNLAADWPGTEAIELLVQRARGLFIYAATVCRFIGDPDWFPQERLPLILQGGTASQSATRKLDEMYAQVLKYSVMEVGEEQDKEELSKRFRQIVGSIVILVDSLSVVALAKLLDVPTWKMDATLSRLRSVLDTSESQATPIRLLHPSFRDFLLDKQRCTDYRIWVNEKESHTNLAENCLRIMSSSLKRDICGLHMPGVFAKEVESSKVEQCLPMDVQYACCYWVHHLQRSDVGLCDNRQIYAFLRKRFLHWLEALSLMGKLSEGILIVTTLQSMLTPDKNPDFFAMVSDAKRFILNTQSIIEKAPLQAYCSALVFSPEMSIIRQQFLGQVPLWIKGLLSVEKNWSSSLQTLEGHSSYVTAVAFSPDGQLLASASWDRTVRLWDPSTGAARGTFEGHSSEVTAVAFSPDGQLLASASWDSTVRLWDIKMRKSIQQFACGSTIHQLSFASDESCLKTDRGVIEFRPLLSNQSRAQLHLPYFVDGNWVTWKTLKILWLPPDYRPSSMDIRSNVLAMGHSSGRITFIQINPHIDPTVGDKLPN